MSKFRIVAACVSLLGVCLLAGPWLFAQSTAASQSGDGVQILGRGPIHEAFATPFIEAKPAPMVARRPPAPITEMPPDVRPDASVVWIAGYWAWDVDTQGFLWVTGCWRVKPNNLDWLPGYWHEEPNGWRWVAGVWLRASNASSRNLTYLPKPPALLNVSTPSNTGQGDLFFAPGGWDWMTGRYSWRAGAWERIRPDQVYVPAQYRWTPQGYVFQAGFWDEPLEKRGVLYAPVAIDEGSIGPDFAFTPTYAVSDVFLLDTLFVKTGFTMYYFGDYYGTQYHLNGFEPAYYQSRRGYEPLIVHEQWVNTKVLRWFDKQLGIVAARDGERAPRPPRTWTTESAGYIATTKTILDARHIKSVVVDSRLRAEVQDVAERIQGQTARARAKVESTRTAPGTTNSAHDLQIAVSFAPPAFTSKKVKPRQVSALPVLPEVTINVETPQGENPENGTNFTGQAATSDSPAAGKQALKGFAPISRPVMTTVPMAQFGVLPAKGEGGKGLGGTGAAALAPGMVGAVNK